LDTGGSWEKDFTGRKNETNREGGKKERKFSCHQGKKTNLRTKKIGGDRAVCTKGGNLSKGKKQSFRGNGGGN